VTASRGIDADRRGCRGGAVFWLTAGREGLDENHAAAAGLARARQHAGLVGGCGLGRLDWFRERRHTEQLARPCDFGVTPVSSAELGCRVARGSFLPVRVLSPVSAIATGGDDGSPRREGAAGEGEPGRVCFSASEDCLPSHEPTPLGSLQRAFSGELSAGEVPQAELAVEQLHDEAVAMPGQCRVVARPLVAQEGMLRVELVPLVEDGGLFEAATD